MESGNKERISLADVKTLEALLLGNDLEVVKTHVKAGLKLPASDFEFGLTYKEGVIQNYLTQVTKDENAYKVIRYVTVTVSQTCKRYNDVTISKVGDFGGQIVQLAAKAKRGLEEILPNLDNLIEGKHSNADAVRLRACDILTDLAGSCGSRAKDCDEFKAATVTFKSETTRQSTLLDKAMQQIKVGLDGLPKRFSVGASAVEEKQPESPEEKETSFFGAFTSAVKKALNIGEQEAEERKLTFELLETLNEKLRPFGNNVAGIEAALENLNLIFKKLKTSLENLKSIVTEKSGCLQTLSESEDVEAVKLQRCHEDLKISLAAWEKIGKAGEYFESQ